MPHIQFSASPKQLSRLRNGHKVRIKPPMEGEGFSSLVVSPDMYSIITRAFSRGKGSEILLSPAELSENKEAAPELEGKGIFGKTGDKIMKKLGIKKIAYKIGDVVKPLVKQAIGYGIEAIVDALVASQPEFAPFRIGAIAVAKNLEEDFLDHPSKYQDALSSPSKAKALIKQKVRDFLVASAKAYATAGVSNQVSGTGTPILDQKFSVNDVVRTGKKLFGKGTPILDQKFSVNDIVRTGKKLVGRGTPILDQKFSVNDIKRTGKKLFGKGTPILDQKFSVNDVVRTGKKLFGKGMRRSHSAPETLAEFASHNDLLQDMNSKLGTTYGALGRANLGTALANKAEAGFIDRGIARQMGVGLYASGSPSGMGLGMGMSSGCGYGMGMHSMRKHSGQISGRGTLLPITQSPALRSQPFSANFQFQHTLPPAFQKFSRGAGLEL